MKIISVENSKSVNVGGTSLRGKIKTTYGELVEKFGPPTFKGGDKTTAEWNLDFYVEDNEYGEEDYVTATIYDWKMDSTPIGEHDWHIGGVRGKNAVDAVHMAMETNEPFELTVG
jgi:hypothetical protein